MFDDREEVDIYYTGKLPRGYVEVIAGASEDDIEDVAGPIVALEYTRWENRKRNRANRSKHIYTLGGILFARQKRYGAEACRGLPIF